MKVSIIGSGMVGSTAGFVLLNNMDIDRLVLIDKLKNIANGNALDLGQAAHALGKDTEIIGSTNPRDLQGSDIIITCAGVPRKPGMTRLDLLAQNARVIQKIGKEIKKYASGQIIIQVTNPLDPLTYLLWKRTGFPREKVLGMGSILDTFRYRYFGGRGVVISEHGSDMLFLNRRIDELTKKQTKEAGAKIIGLKGYTSFAPAASVYRLVRAVVENTNEVLPVSLVLDGEYGISGMAIGVLARVNSSGAEIIEQELSKKQREHLQSSASKLKELLNELQEG